MIQQYSGYDDFVNEIELEAKKLGVSFKDENELRMYVLRNKSPVFYSRLGKLNFDEANFVCRNTENGYFITKRSNNFSEAELKKLAETYVEHGEGNLFKVDLDLLDSKFIKNDERVLNHVVKTGKLKKVVELFDNNIDLDTAKVLLLNNSLYLILDYLDPEYHLDLVKFAYTSADFLSNYNKTPSNQYMTKEILDYIYSQDESIKYSFHYYFENLDIESIYKYIRIFPDYLYMGSSDVEKYFESVYYKYKRNFILEHNEFTFLKDAKLNFKNKNIEEAFKALDINTIYIAYNEYRVWRYNEDKYKED